MNDESLEQDAPVPDPTDSPSDLFAEVPAPTGGAWWRLGLPLLALIALATFWSAPLVIVILGVLGLVAVHEAGHLVVARRCGVLTSEYSIGIGPVIYSRRARGMAWSLRAIPAGAFVRVVGMSAADKVPEEFEAQTYRRATLPRRLAIVFAGPGANFVAASVLMLVALLTWGKVDSNLWEVSGVGKHSAAAAAGIEDGERVVSVAGRPVKTFDAMAAAVADRPGKLTDVAVLDPTSGKVRDIRTELGDRITVWGTVGEDLNLTARDGDVVVEYAVPNGVVEAAGLAEGDQIVSVNGTTIESTRDVEAAVIAASTGSLTIAARHPGASLPFSATVKLGANVATPGPTGVLGVGQHVPAVPLSVGPATVETGRQLATTAAASVRGLATFLWPPNIVSFISGAVLEPHVDTAEPAAASDPAADPKRVVSVVGAVGIGAALAEISPGALLWFLALMNLFIGLFNLVPLPPLDGGHIAVALYERLHELTNPARGRHLVNPARLNRFATAVIAVLLCVGVAAIWLDITAPLG